MQLHFGKLDTHIPAEQVEKVRAAHPGVEIHWYEGAGHGFSCDMRASYNPDAAAQARTRCVGVSEEAPGLAARSDSPRFRRLRFPESQLARS